MRASTRSVITILLLVLALVCLGSSCKLGGPEALKSVTFNPNGGKGTMVSQTFTNGTTQKLATNTFTRDGYTFKCWNTAKNGEGTSYADNADFTYDSRDSGITLFAQWSENKDAYYTIEFINTLDSTDPHVTQKIQCNTNTKLTDLKDLGFHYSKQFVDWRTANDGSKEGRTFSNGQSVKDIAKLGETIKLYSRWIIDISYNLNGGVVDTPISDQTEISLSEILLNDGSSIKYQGEDPILSSEYHVFRGWCTDKNGYDGDIYLKDSSGTVKAPTIANDSQLYAKWGFNYDLADISYPNVFYVNCNEINQSKHHQQTYPGFIPTITLTDAVILATGNLWYCDEDGAPTSELATRELPDTSSPYRYAVTTSQDSWDYKVYRFSDGDMTRHYFYKEPETDVIVIMRLSYNADFNENLPSKDYISSWGNLADIVKSLGNSDHRVWSGTSASDSEAYYVTVDDDGNLTWNLAGKNFDKITRLVTALF